MTISTKQRIHLCIPIFILFLPFFLSPPEGLTQNAFLSITLLLSSIWLWLSKALPWAVTTFLATSLTALLGILTPDTLFQQFGSSLLFFMIATFSITIALSQTDIPLRLAACILKRSNRNPVKLIFGFMCAAALLSSIMSNVPSCSVFASLALVLCPQTDEKSDGLEKSLLIAIPFACVIGGFMTPAGTPGNILTIALYESLTGNTISFLQWMSLGIPMSLVALGICGLWIIVCLRPQAPSLESTDQLYQKVATLGSFSGKEKKTLCIIGLMFSLWIASSWVPILNTTVVAVFCMCLFFLPGIEILSWDEYCKSAPWDIIFMVSGVGALAYSLTATGASSWLVSILMAAVGTVDVPVFMLLASSIIAVLHMVIPSGGAAVAVGMPPLILLALELGIPTLPIAFICGFWGAVVLVLPVDAVTIITYSLNRYSAKDLIIAGIVPTALLIAISAILLPWLAI